MIDIQLVSQACLSKVKLGQSLKTVFPQELGRLASSGDQAVVKNTVYGALRYLGYLEFSLDSLVSKRPNGLVNLLLVGIYLSNIVVLLIMLLLMRQYPQLNKWDLINWRV